MAADAKIEVSVLIPTQTYRRSWAVLLHDRNADRLVWDLGRVPHVNATIVPFNARHRWRTQPAGPIANPPRPS